MGSLPLYGGTFTRSYSVSMYHCLDHGFGVALLFSANSSCSITSVAVFVVVVAVFAVGVVIAVAIAVAVVVQRTCSLSEVGVLGRGFATGQDEIS